MGPPRVSGLFLVIFDQRIGYKIAFSRSLPNLDLDGVEYKSLPSGLHAVEEDVIFFRHADLVGASVFQRGEADESQRNASFAAAGVLVPLSGALGRGWEHAEELRGLAKSAVSRPDNTAALEAFWEQHRLHEENGDGKRQRAGSESTFLLPATEPLQKDHPALAVPEVLELFGPLLFPLQRAVLARKRILFLGTAPVKNNALAAWLASILGNIPQDQASGNLSEGLSKTNSLFNIGIHDIATLPGKKEANGWLACTTDSILAEKNALWDVLVRLPPAQSPSHRTWPTLQTSDSRMVKASQRDLRRWTLLRRELRRLRFQICGKHPNDTTTESVSEDDQRPLLERRRTSDDSHDTFLKHRDESEAVEAPTWTAVAYRGFMWWASAGEASAWEEDETKADEELLFDLPDIGALSPGASRNGSGDREAEYARAAATVLVANFRRVTQRIMGSLASIVDEADDDTEEGIEDEEIQITGDDVREMGLDRWGEADRLFARDMVEKWFGRNAVVVDDGLTVCGVRLC